MALKRLGMMKSLAHWRCCNCLAGQLYVLFLITSGLSYLTVPLQLPAGGLPDTVTPTMRVLRPELTLHADHAVLVTLAAGTNFSVTLLLHCRLGAGIQCKTAVTSMLTGASCTPAMDAASAATALLAPGLFIGSDAPQLLALSVAGPAAGELLVLDGGGGCTSWGVFGGTPLEVAVSDVNNDDNEDLLIAGAMQSVIGISDGRGAFKLEYGGGSGLEGAANLAPFVAHNATGDVCRPQNASKRVMKGGWTGGPPLSTHRARVLLPEAA